MTTKIQLTACLSAALIALTSVAAAPALAAPPPPPGGYYGHRPAAPRVEHRHYHSHTTYHRSYRSSHHTGDVILGTLAAGAAIYGIASLIDSANHRSSVVQQPMATTTITTTTTTTQTVFWCEAEKGFYPQVRACPTGWTPIAANAVPSDLH